MNGTLEPGQVIGGRWRIDQYLASGGFGQVYAATDISTAAIGAVAVKVLLEGASTAERQAFLTEAVHMSALRHPNLVAHIDSGMLSQHDGAVYLVIDLCDESLREHIERQTSGTIRPERLEGLVADLSAGLGYLHRSGRVHRDLKPGNILRAGDRWKLADFGLVRDLTQSGVYHLQSLVGSPRYMAPEFFSDGMVGSAADIWAVGVIIHEIMTGQTVYSGEGPAYIHRVTTTAPSISQGLDPTLEHLIRCCLAPDPAGRPSADELPSLLAGTGAAMAWPAPTAPPSTPAPNPASMSGSTPIPSPAPTASPARVPTDDSTARVAPPSAAARPESLAPAGTAEQATTGDPAGGAPIPVPAAGVVGLAATADGGGQPPAAQGAPPLLPPAQTGRAGSSRGRLAILAGCAALAVIALAALAIRSGDDGAETAGTDQASALASSTEEVASPSSTDRGDTGTGPSADAEATADDTGSDPGSDGEDREGSATPGRGEGPEGGTGDPTTSPGPRAMVALDEFVADECADVDDTERFVIDTVVPCTDPHLFQVLSIYEAPQAGGDYPGPDALFQLGVARCPQAFLDRFGTDQADTSLSVLSFGPSEQEWGQQIYSVVCAMYRADLQPLSGPIGDDVDDWLWKPGDSLTAVELQRGHCFDTPVPLEIQGFGQRVLFADCEQPHDGQYYDSVLLEQPEGGYTDPLEILADGKPLCHDALHERYGDDHREAGFTDTVLVQNPTEYQQAPTNLLLCIVLWDQPTPGTLEDIVAE